MPKQYKQDKALWQPIKRPAISIAEMVHRYVELKEPLFVIGLDAKLSDVLVRWYLTNEGVQIRPRGSLPKTPREIKNRTDARGIYAKELHDWDKIRRMYEEDGMSFREIAQEIGISYGTVRVNLITLGLTPRKPRNPNQRQPKKPIT